MNDSAIELLRRALDRYRERDFEALAQLLHAEVVAVVAVPLGAKHSYKGRDAVVAMLRERDRAYAEYQVQVHTLTAGGGGVLAEGFAHYKPVGGGQGATQAFYWVCEVRHGMIVRWEAFANRREALTAAGLPANQPD
jgi:ketosteroid isomerase-like protein